MTTHTTPIDLRPYHGRECEIVLTNGKIIKSKIMLDRDKDLYVKDKNGPVWIQDKQFPTFLKSVIKSITLLDEPKSINPEWDWKDGEEVYLRGNKYKCHMLKDDLVCFASAATGVCRKLFTLKAAYNHGFRKLPPPPQRKLVEITEEMFRSTAWYGKKVMYGELEQGVYAVHYNSGFFTLVQSGTVHYSQCKLIEE